MGISVCALRIYDPKEVLRVYGSVPLVSGCLGALPILASVAGIRLCHGCVRLCLKARPFIGRSLSLVMARGRTATCKLPVRICFFAGRGT